MSDFFFSIIIPVYNTEKYLNRALLSIAKQTFPLERVEVVIVNDASPNGSECSDIAKEWKEKLNIEYIDLEKNSGTYVARKTGVSASKGKYILNLDPDDTFKKNLLSALCQDIEKNGDADYIEYNIDQILFGFLRLKYFNYKTLEKKGVFEVLSGKASVSLVNKCFSSSFLKPVYQKMENTYIVYTEDRYPIAIIEYYAKTRRLLAKTLYSYTHGVGVCSLRNYTKNQIKIFILSYWNLKNALSNFFKNEEELSYLPIIEEKYGLNPYILTLKNSQNVDDFISVASEVLSQELINQILIGYIKETKPVFEKLKRRNWLSSFFEKLFRNLKEQINLIRGIPS